MNKCFAKNCNKPATGCPMCYEHWTALPKTVRAEVSLDGKKLTLKYSKGWVELNKSGDLVENAGLRTGIDLNYSERKIYEEPKKKKKVWQWRMKIPTEPKWEVDCYLHTEEEIEEERKKYPNIQFEKLAGP